MTAQLWGGYTKAKRGRFEMPRTEQKNPHPSRGAQTDLAVCPHCGRMFVRIADAPCPHCGYPLSAVLDRTIQVSVRKRPTGDRAA